MSKSKMEIVEDVASAADMTKAQAQRAVDAMMESVFDEIKNGGKVTIVGFGTFQVKDQAARTGRNPATGEPMEIPAKKVVKFKPGKRLQEAAA